jgi:hypothetical protein
VRNRNPAFFPKIKKAIKTHTALQSQALQTPTDQIKDINLAVPVGS